jgi:hypothetical protein
VSGKNDFYDYSVTRGENDEVIVTATLYNNDGANIVMHVWDENQREFKPLGGGEYNYVNDLAETSSTQFSQVIKVENNLATVAYLAFWQGKWRVVATKVNIGNGQRQGETKVLLTYEGDEFMYNEAVDENGVKLPYRHTSIFDAKVNGDGSVAVVSEILNNEDNRADLKLRVSNLDTGDNLKTWYLENPAPVNRLMPAVTWKNWGGDKQSVLAKYNEGNLTMVEKATGMTSQGQGANRWSEYDVTSAQTSDGTQDWNRKYVGDYQGAIVIKDGVVPRVIMKGLGQGDVWDPTKLIEFFPKHKTFLPIIMRQGWIIKENTDETRTGLARLRENLPWLPLEIAEYQGHMLVYNRDIADALMVDPVLGMIIGAKEEVRV